MLHSLGRLVFCTFCASLTVIVVDDSIFGLSYIMNQIFVFQLTFVVSTFNNVVIIISTSGLTSIQQKFSLQTVRRRTASRV